MSRTRQWTRICSRLGVLLPLMVGPPTLTLAVPAQGQRAGDSPADPAPAVVGVHQTPMDTIPYQLAPVVVTATRTARPVFTTPAPVNVIGARQIRAAQANTVSDLFREAPGLDVAGVGVQQPRPVIRGQRGQRILLLQDAMRLNNSRRQQEFGEIPGVIDLATVERVEVVRGPSSVLYGTDAIGGVVNVISRTPTVEGVTGQVGYRFGEAGQLHRGTANVYGRFGPLDLQVHTSLRDAGSYTAPAGNFGSIRIDAPTTVFGTGVRDRALSSRIAYRLGASHSVFARADSYDASEAGFGFVDPVAYDPTQARIEILYPDQAFRKLTLGYSGTGLGTVLADRADVMAYLQGNRRAVEFNLDQRLGPPGAAINVQQFNDSDITTYGVRLEAKKLAAGSVLLTYGVDAFLDRSENSDSSVTRITGFGPPQVHVSARPQVPNAEFRSAGGFVQGELTLGQTALVLGTRLQEVRAETFATEGLTETFQSKSNRTAVGAASVMHSLTPDLVLIGSLGRGFRSPNLVEWFYDGLSTDGRYYQARNLELEPETSLNVDLGGRYRNGWISVEAFAFRNRIRDGIRTLPTDQRVDNRVVYRNVNIDELVFRGVEATGEILLPHRFSLGFGHARQQARDARDANIPVGDIYSSKTLGALRYGTDEGRFWGEYGVRHQGDQRDADLQDNPVGDVLPGFTTHHLRGGVTLFSNGRHTHRLGITVGNLTNRLYAETANTSFFRPEPRRHVILSWEAGF